MDLLLCKCANRGSGLYYTIPKISYTFHISYQRSSTCPLWRKTTCIELIEDPKFKGEDYKTAPALLFWVEKQLVQ